MAIVYVCRAEIGLKGLYVARIPAKMKKIQEACVVSVSWLGIDVSTRPLIPNVFSALPS